MNHKKTFIREYGWLLMAVLAVTLLALWLLSVVYERVEQKDSEQDRSTTMSDLYWFDQTVNNQVNRDQQIVWGVAREIAAGKLNASQFKARTEGLLVDFPELSNVVWLNKKGEVLGRAANVQVQSTADPDARERLERTAQNRAIEMHQTTATVPILMKNGTYELSLIQPFYNVESDELQGFIKSQYMVKDLLAQATPDWFARKYHLHVYFEGMTMYSTMHDEQVRFDENSPSVERNIYITTTPLVVKVQMYPDKQALVLRGLFGGVILLLFGLAGSLLALVRDVRNRRETERELREAYELRHAIERSLTVGIRTHRNNGMLFYANPAFCEMIGFEESELLNLSLPLSYVPDSETEKVRTLVARLAAHPEPFSIMDLKLRRKTGEIIDTVMRGNPMFDEQQQQIGWITTVENVTEHRRLEAYQATEQKRLESVSHLVSMGEMASVIAHELSQPLSAISGYAAGLSNYIKKDPNAISAERLTDVSEKIRRQAERAANVTRRIQSFAQSKTMLPEVINSYDLVEQTIELMELELRKKYCVVHNRLIKTELKPIKIDVTMAQQILINLMRNGLDAMVEHGSNPREIIIEGENYSEQHVLITVRDNGFGVPAHKVETIFKPFYTTKTHGVGIGLNICRTMIESNGGRLWAKADESGGLFYLTLPIAPPKNT